MRLELFDKKARSRERDKKDKKDDESVSETTLDWELVGSGTYAEL
jgi:hypothetical protein